ncbi:hypothetical protein MUO14_17165 [Halobacillus shinanisalinarum]|uniref:DUF4362 domain-containing protein n=1 Tax=Halobacillus shinanisalinarum TaxID=2932258 RepID=A0ABY4GVM9_9BACI|nr:hypothetical protein [Halobacillus shinanisalinarum]UOQ92203.1 hypothetical protein MUO14_17165 [Halobacillus shinanisalinarum]
MNRDKKSAKSNNESTVKSKKKVIAISLFIVLSVVLVLQGCNTENESANNIDIAAKKVSDLFEVEDEEKVKEGKSSKIKDSTGKEQIDEALEVIDKIDTSDGEQSENYAIAFSLQSAVLNAQLQLKEREGTLESSDNSAQDEQKEEEFHPDEDDVVLKNNELKNKDILEEFMKVAGENGKNNESEIRVVKDKGPLIYDLKSRYDKNADQSWIGVIPDLSHYSASENEVKDVFNTRQQCGYMSKDKQEGYYKLNKCQTHWAYRFLPIVNDNEK